LLIDRLKMDVYQQVNIVQWSRCLVSSYRQWLDQDLIAPTDDDQLLARRLFQAPFVVVSHGTQADPILNYGNQTALDLWELDWRQFTQTPSRKTAAPLHRQERAQMLAQLSSQGYIDNYQGVRISSRGRRFQIHQAVVWNVVDAEGCHLGQGATFSRWIFLD
jgi:hypothetical protein